MLFLYQDMWAVVCFVGILVRLVASTPNLVIMVADINNVNCNSDY